MNLEKQVKLNKSNGETSVILATDLTAAFDTIDHLILLQKMEHIGIRGKPLEVIQSYLSERQSYCEVQGFCGKLRPSRAYSVIQGGKLSGQFFGIFTIEMTMLKKVMENESLFRY